MTSDAMKYDPDYAVPPGETIKELMVSTGNNEEHMADQLGMPVFIFRRLLAGELALSNKIADRLGLMFETTNFWVQRELWYRERLAREAVR